jgi:hypothetical protein
MVISLSAWVSLGAVVGAGLAPLVRHSLTRTDGLGDPVLLGLTTAIVFVLLAWRVLRWPDLVGYSAFAAFGIAGSVVDIAEHRLPARLVLPAYSMAVGLFGAARFFNMISAAWPGLPQDCLLCLGSTWPSRWSREVELERATSDWQARSVGCWRGTAGLASSWGRCSPSCSLASLAWQQLPLDPLPDIRQSPLGPPWSLGP